MGAKNLLLRLLGGIGFFAPAKRLPGLRMTSFFNFRRSYRNFRSGIIPATNFITLHSIDGSNSPPLAAK
jgi:hypothetical protein